MAGTFGNAGLLVFSLLIGALMLKIDYTPFFIFPGLPDVIGAMDLWTLVKGDVEMADNSVTMIQNPILRGFNPDPSIVRVGHDYYSATSTFEWFPGVQIHHPRDLVHWRLLTRSLKRPSQLNMTGDPDSGGVWAPCLTYDGPPGPPNFTGAFVGMCCQDYAGTGWPADFDYFEYRERAFSAAP
jgi:beta-xylosidase